MGDVCGGVYGFVVINCCGRRWCFYALRAVLKLVFLRDGREAAVNCAIFAFFNASR